jgi:hypothetical protein
MMACLRGAERDLPTLARRTIHSPPTPLVRRAGDVAHTRTGRLRFRL